ncbi:hypothetical protein FQN49_005872 [Arthroderma sp. PD_2]|nr:hypothetical protein FQN49_005872 [Arthroderma sp. PD_2]
MDIDSTSPPNPLSVEEEAYEIAPRAPGKFSLTHLPGQPYRTQDLHPKFVYAEEIQEPTESRERRHAALGVLDDLEMLMFHAVSNNESIPQTRQRFIHSLARRPADTPPLRKHVIHDIEAGRLLQAHKSDAVAASMMGGALPMSLPGRRWMDDGRSLAGTLERMETPIVDIVEVNGGWRNEYIGDAAVAAVAGAGVGAAAGAGARGEASGMSSSMARKGKGRA